MLIADLERNGFHPPRDVAVSSDSLIWATAFLELYRSVGPVILEDPLVLEQWFRGAIAQGYCSGQKAR